MKWREEIGNEEHLSIRNSGMTSMDKEIVQKIVKVEVAGRLAVRVTYDDTGRMRHKGVTVNQNSHKRKLRRVLKGKNKIEEIIGKRNRAKERGQ